MKRRTGTARISGQEGFTLVELLVVMIIIAILLAIAIPSYLGFRDRANQKTAEANVREAASAAEAFFQDNGSYAALSVPGLRAIDAGLSPDVAVVSSDDDSYCLSADHNGKLAYLTGPNVTISTTACT